MIVLVRKVSLRDGAPFSAVSLKVLPFNYLPQISWQKDAESWVYLRPSYISVSGSRRVWGMGGCFYVLWNWRTTSSRTGRGKGKVPELLDWEQCARTSSLNCIFCALKSKHTWPFIEYLLCARHTSGALYLLSQIIFPTTLPESFLFRRNW